MSRAVTWVVVGPEPHLAHCERCGRTVPKPPMPCPIPVAVAYMRAYVAEHRGCRAVEGAGALPAGRASDGGVE